MHPLPNLVVWIFLTFGRPELKKLSYEIFEVPSFFNRECWNAETAAKRTKWSHWHQFGQNLPVLSVSLKIWAKFEVQIWLLFQTIFGLLLAMLLAFPPYPDTRIPGLNANAHIGLLEG